MEFRLKVWNVVDYILEMKKLKESEFINHCANIKQKLYKTLKEKSFWDHSYAEIDNAIVKCTVVSILKSASVLQNFFCSS